MSIEAMKLALDALTFTSQQSPAVENLVDDAIAALTQAIAEAEKQTTEESSATQEHSFWEDVANELRLEIATLQDKNRLLEKQLEAAQPKREPLTDEQIQNTAQHYTEFEGFCHGARWAIEQLQEKNT